MSAGRLPYGKQLVEDDDVQEVVECLRSAWLTQGPRVQAFEEALAEATGARHAVAVCNGTVALHLAAVGLGVRPGDAGIVPAVTFLSTAHCLRYAGGDAVFADVEPDTGLVDPASVSDMATRMAASGRPPRLLVPVDLTGLPSDWDAMRRIADAHGAKVLLDAAHSLGATSDGQGRARRVGESGADAGILSFHPVKHVTTAEGGAVLTNDAGLHQELVELRTFGMHKDPARFVRPPDDPFVGPWYYETNVLGFNYRLSDVHCALGMSQLGKLPRFVARRREIAARYDRALREPPLAGRLAPLGTHPGRHSSHHLYVARIADEAEPGRAAVKRRELFLHLAARDIHCQVHYVPLPWQPYYRALETDPERRYPGATRYYAGCLSLPMFPALTDADVDRVVAALVEWAGG